MKKSKIVGTIVAAVVIVVGVFVLVYNAVIVYNSDLKYISYKSVEGTVSTVQSSYVDGVSYYMATYSFIVDGTSYNCDSGLTDDGTKYQVGGTATIRYNPKIPSNCFIESNSRIWNYLYLGISCIVLIIGIRLFDKQIKME